MEQHWDRLIRRAEQLASAGDAAQNLLRFYGAVLTAQKAAYSRLRDHRDWFPTGDLARDLRVVRARVTAPIEAAAAHGSEALAREARQVLEGGARRVDEILVDYWRAPSDLQFLGKASVQPYARWIADAGVRPAGRPPTSQANRCPFCGGSPQLASLQEASGPGEGGGRTLLCATCLTWWPFGRLTCAACGEEDERQLGYFHSPNFDHVRVEACERCHRYLKGIDRTRLGIAEPLVDEVAAAALDVWAREHGYTKLELNLVGL